MFRPLGGILFILETPEPLCALEKLTGAWIHKLVSSTWVKYHFWGASYPFKEPLLLTLCDVDSKIPQQTPLKWKPKKSWRVIAIRGRGRGAVRRDILPSILPQRERVRERVCGVTWPCNPRGDRSPVETHSPLRALPLPRCRAPTSLQNTCTPTRQNFRKRGGSAADAHWRTRNIRTYARSHHSKELARLLIPHFKDWGGLGTGP